MPEIANYTPEVRKGIISLLMFQIYSEQRTIYREYVQNALDAINKAVEERVLNANKDGKVEIVVDTNNKKVTITDNGTGIKSDLATKTLLDISSSTKDGIQQAGQFGIGRLVGGGYCHKLVFRTSAIGEEVGTIVTFDVDKIWKLVKNDKKDYLATYVISECTIVQQFACVDTEHFFEVTLEGIRDEFAPTLLDRNKVIEYLNEVAPVEYTPQFNNTLIYSSLNAQPEFKELFNQLEKVQVFVNGKRIQKQYGLTVKGTKDEINNLEFFKIEDSKYGMLAWGWFALTKYSIQIPKSDSLAGIRLRKHNIQIGTSNQLSGTKYWREDRSNSYFYGEIFATHPEIMPNGARDGLAPSPVTFQFNKSLQEYFENLKMLYTKANTAKKCVDKINDGYQRLKKMGVYDYNSKDLVENKGIAVFGKLMRSAAFGPLQRMLLLYRPLIDEAKKRVDTLLEEMKNKKKSNNHSMVTPTTSKPTNAVQPIEEPNDISKANQSELESQHQQPLTTKQAQDQHPLSQDTQRLQHPALPFVDGTFNVVHSVDTLSPTTTPLLGMHDIVSRLDGQLEPNEVFLVRRIFRVLNTYCPANEHDQLLVRSLEECIVKELSNGQ